VVPLSTEHEPGPEAHTSTRQNTGSYTGNFSVDQAGSVDEADVEGRTNRGGLWDRRVQGIAASVATNAGALGVPHPVVASYPVVVG